MNFALAFRLALRNVGAYRVKNLVVGAILAFGTFIVVTGGALLDSLTTAMQASVSSSVTGELQIYAKNARDPLALLGEMGMSASDYGEIDAYEKVAEVAKSVPGVRLTLPMAKGQAVVFSGNDIDIVLADLRGAVGAGDTAKSNQLFTRVRRIAADLQPEMESLAKLSSDTEKIAEDRAIIERVMADTFEAEFSAAPLPTIDWLDSHLAPLATDGKMVYLSTLGTDLDAFPRAFDKFELVEGSLPPAGTRGILLPQAYTELWLKHTCVRELDQIKDSVHIDGEKIGTTGTLYDRVQRNSRQYRRILYQLSPEAADALEPKLRAELGGMEGDLATLLKAFLAVTDENLDKRYAFLYKEITPAIRLYEVKIGDTLALRSFTKSGYMKALNVKVWGIYHNKGFTSRDMMSDAITLIDLVSFRDLYGKMTDTQRAELDVIKASVGATDVSRDNAEDALFGGGGGAVESAMESGTGLADFDEKGFGTVDTRVSDTFDQRQMASGLVLNTAIRLDDPRKVEETRLAVQAALDKAGLPDQVVTWRDAAGMIGQMVSVVQVVMVLAVGVMFLVSMVIINNALVMATMERTGEIGTMRAVGAQRGFVVMLFVMETLIVGLFAGVTGSAISAAFIGWLHATGIPAGADFFTLLFGGPRLYPDIGAANVAVGVGLVAIVSIIATLYPSILASSVPPVVALQGKE